MNDSDRWTPTVWASRVHYLAGQTTLCGRIPSDDAIQVPRFSRAVPWCRTCLRFDQEGLT